MKWRKGFIKHSKSRDVMFEVTEDPKVFDKFVILIGEWWNSGENHAGRGWPLGVTQVITINKSQYKNWKYLEVDVWEE